MVPALIQFDSYGPCDDCSLMNLVPDAVRVVFALISALLGANTIWMSPINFMSFNGTVWWLVSVMQV